MGKITVIGRAEKKVMPDRCRVRLELREEKDTAAEASAATTRQCEKLLQVLEQGGLAPEQIFLETDRISQESNYRSEKNVYVSYKALRLDLPADTETLGAVRDVIESDFAHVSMETSFELSSEEEIRRELLKEAIARSRAEAELLAVSMEKEIIGVDSANLSGTEEYAEEAEEETGDGAVPMLRMAKAFGAAPHDRTDRLKPAELTRTAQVRIVWLLSE